ncbi:CBM35 domain-containing protein [Streptomyces longwoodensis]
MTPGNNGASTPEDDDPFGYLYADGQANGAQPPSSSGYGYPNAVGRVRAVGERQYGQQQTQPYGQQPSYGQHGAPPQQQAAYGRPNAHYAAPETLPGGAPTSRQQSVSGGGGGGRGRGPNTKGLLIGAVAVVAAVVIGIAVAMANGNTDDDKGGGDQAASTPTASASASPSESSTSEATEAKLPKIDAKALHLEGGAATASDVPGAQADGGIYVANLSQVGAAVTWTVNGIPESGKYTLYVRYGVPGKDATATLTVNGAAQSRPVNMANFAKAPEGDYAKGWTTTWSNLELTKGTNTVKISCEQSDTCQANLDQLWLVKGWKS